MSRFVYRLQAVLDRHRHAERRSVRVLATARAALAHTTAAYDASRQNVAAAWRQLAAMQPSCAIAYAERDRSLQLSLRISEAHAVSVDLARREVQTARVEAWSARRKVSALERHRERRYEAFLWGEALRGAAELDERNGRRDVVRPCEARRSTAAVGARSKGSYFGMSGCDESTAIFQAPPVTTPHDQVAAGCVLDLSVRRHVERGLSQFGATFGSVTKSKSLPRGVCCGCRGLPTCEVRPNVARNPASP